MPDLDEFFEARIRAIGLNRGGPNLKGYKPARFAAGSSKGGEFAPKGMGSVSYGALKKMMDDRPPIVNPGAPYEDIDDYMRPETRYGPSPRPAPSPVPRGGHVMRPNKRRAGPPGSGRVGNDKYVSPGGITWNTPPSGKWWTDHQRAVYSLRPDGDGFIVQIEGDGLGDVDFRGMEVPIYRASNHMDAVEWIDRNHSPENRDRWQSGKGRLSDVPAVPVGSEEPGPASSGPRMSAFSSPGSDAADFDTVVRTLRQLGMPDDEAQRVAAKMVAERMLGRGEQPSGSAGKWEKAFGDSRFRWGKTPGGYEATVGDQGKWLIKKTGGRWTVHGPNAGEPSHTAKSLKDAKAWVDDNLAIYDDGPYTSNKNIPGYRFVAPVQSSDIGGGMKTWNTRDVYGRLWSVRPSPGSNRFFRVFVGDSPYPVADGKVFETSDSASARRHMVMKAQTAHLAGLEADDIDAWMRDPKTPMGSYSGFDLSSILGGNRATNALTIPKSRGHLAFTDEFEYFSAPDGSLWRAPIGSPMRTDIPNRDGARWYASRRDIPLVMRKIETGTLERKRRVLQSEDGGVYSNLAAFSSGDLAGAPELRSDLAAMLDRRAAAAAGGNPGSAFSSPGEIYAARGMASGSDAIAAAGFLRDSNALRADAQQWLQQNPGDTEFSARMTNLLQSDQRAREFLFDVKGRKVGMNTWKGIVRDADAWLADHPGATGPEVEAIKRFASGYKSYSGIWKGIATDGLTGKYAVGSHDEFMAKVKAPRSGIKRRR
jgi:hypothetical protein